jgi:hypothetical protein
MLELQFLYVGVTVIVVAPALMPVDEKDATPHSNFLPLRTVNMLVLAVRLTGLAAIVICAGFSARAAESVAALSTKVRIKTRPIFLELRAM